VRLPPTSSSTLDPALDALLVARCLAGESRAWDALVRRHERLVYAVARSYRLDNEDLGDVFQEVFAALVRGLPRLRDTRTLVRWLSSTTDRVARRLALKRRRELALSQSEPAEVERLTAPGPPVGADLEALEQRALVRLALERLAPRCRELLGALYTWDDTPPAYADVARRLGMPVGSLGPTRARCLERLRAALAALEGGADDARISGAAVRTFRVPEGPGPRRGRPTRRRSLATPVEGAAR
jgi:RNA polymerase sigma factor (sigma-70 family)